MALNNLMSEGYLHIKKTGRRVAGYGAYNKKLRILKERFRDGRKWQMMQQ